MKSYEKVMGIDVSKKKLHLSLFDGTKHRQYQIENDISSMEEFLKQHPEEDFSHILFVMESTGVYHLRIALFLAKDLSYQVSVVNPLVIKKYAEMLLKRTKTDKVDARLIAQYGYHNSPPPFLVRDEESYELDQLLKGIEDLQLQMVTLKNQIEALTHQPYINQLMLTTYQEVLSQLKKKVKELEKEVKKIIANYAPQEFLLLKSIPGIGDRVAAALLAMLNRFEYFDNAKEVCSFCGLSPGSYQSGETVKKKRGIVKKGNRYLRKMLYVAALSASRYNPDCKRLYQRLLSKGRPKKVALVAVANKLLRQAFAVVKSGIPYDPNYLEKKMNLLPQTA